MMPRAPIDFTLQGEFAGIVRTPSGKKRLILRVNGEEILLKVQRDLRQELARQLAPGTPLEVAGVIRTELFTGETKRVVTYARPAGAGRSAEPCTIKICAKKNCWKQGGRELWRAMETEIVAQGLAGTVRLKAVGCLDECNHAPNLECHGQLHRRCSPAQAAAFLSALSGSIPSPAGEIPIRILDAPC